MESKSPLIISHGATKKKKITGYLPCVVKFLHGLDQDVMIHVKPQRNVYSLPKSVCLHNGSL